MESNITETQPVCEESCEGVSEDLTSASQLEKLEQEPHNQEANGYSVDSGETKISFDDDSTDLKERIKILEKEVSELKDKNLRLLADFENHKKNVLKRESENFKYQGERIFVDLLDIVDNFERAFESAKGTKVENSSAEEVAVKFTQLKDGVELIYRELLNVLAKWGLRSEPGIGKQFDPNIQNAISKIPVQEGQTEGVVVAELKKTYWYKDKMVRVGEVVVAG